jgi:branched-chain amino acid transport system substrate-binding protein
MSTPCRIALLAATFVAGLGLAAQAQAQTIKVGATFSQTGPAASLGIPDANSMQVLPTKIGGADVQYIVLDDGGDTSRAVANTRKLIDEDNVDMIIGSTVTPASLAMIGVVAEKKVPMCAAAASGAIIAPMDDNRHWVFKTPQNDSLMSGAIVEHMQKKGIKTVGFIGFSDAYGDGWLANFSAAAKAAGIEVVTAEKYARTDTSVTGQILKIMALKPQAVLIAASGTPAVLPEKTLKERGYKGVIYQTHGVANTEFLKLGGKDVEGTYLPTGPFLVAEQLPDSNPTKAVSLDYKKKYEAKFGAGTVSTFGANAYDCGLLFAAAVPGALARATPGTAEFRAALRDGIEGLKNFPLDHGVATMTPTDHNGFDTNARLMVQIVGGAWKIQP